MTQNTRGKGKVLSHSKKRKATWTSSFSSSTDYHRYITFNHQSHEERYQYLKDRAVALVHNLLAVTLWEQFFAIVESSYAELTFECFSTFFLLTVLSSADDPRAISFRLGGITQHFSIAGFGVALDLYSDDFLAMTKLSSLPQHIHHSASLYWLKIAEVVIPYNLSQSKAWCFPPVVRYIHTILAHTLTG
ncbi:hypothetical protein GOBAR_AA07349 [Gossypium barbadense]|uniref:Uncharacterized protein n=1 Tax=Gossypium barbadense TaxID=3634 RepID=A0A2P5YCI1_GOSBA|nr:hypothetical protein GOBAR_AA07349 [Gossypium barbadense]